MNNPEAITGQRNHAADIISTPTVTNPRINKITTGNSANPANPLVMRRNIRPILFGGVACYFLSANGKLIK